MKRKYEEGHKNLHFCIVTLLLFMGLGFTVLHLGTLSGKENKILSSSGRNFKDLSWEFFQITSLTFSLVWIYRIQDLLLKFSFLTKGAFDLANSHFLEKLAR